MKETKKISKNAGFRNKGTFTVAQNKIVEPKNSCRLIDRNRNMTKSPILHDFTPYKQEKRTRNVGKNDHRGLT